MHEIHLPGIDAANHPGQAKHIGVGQIGIQNILFHLADQLGQPGQVVRNEQLAGDCLNDQRLVALPGIIAVIQRFALADEIKRGFAIPMLIAGGQGPVIVGQLDGSIQLDIYAADRIDEMLEPVEVGFDVIVDGAAA